MVVDIVTLVSSLGAEARLGNVAAQEVCIALAAVLPAAVLLKEVDSRIGDELLTVSQASRVVHRSPWTIRDYVEDGLIAYRIPSQSSRGVYLIPRAGLMQKPNHWVGQSGRGHVS